MWDVDRPFILVFFLLFKTGFYFPHPAHYRLHYEEPSALTTTVILKYFFQTSNKPHNLGSFRTFQQFFQDFPGHILSLFPGLSRTVCSIECQHGKLTILEANTINNHHATLLTTVVKLLLQYILYHTHIICTSL